MSAPLEPATVSWLLPVAIAVIGAVTTCFGVWASSHYSYRNLLTQIAANSASEKRAWRRERVEELYMAFQGWASSMELYFQSTENVIRGFRKDVEDEVEGKDFVRVHMLSKLYFPSVKNQLRDVDEVLIELRCLEADFRSGQVLGEVCGDGLAVELDRVVSKFNAVCRDYLEALAKNAIEEF